MFTAHRARRLAAVSGGWAAVFSAAALLAQEPRSQAVTYGKDRDFLAAHTSVLELTNESGARVAICPEYQGRIMTSSCDGLEGRSLGWVNRAFIEKREKDERFNNYGGEDRFWLGPEGGQFSLWFAAGQPQKVDHWYTPAGLNDGAFAVKSGDSDPYYRLARRMNLTNAAGTKFELEVVRDIQLVALSRFGKLFGEQAQQLVSEARLKMVGFQSINTLINRGPPMQRDRGLVAIWVLGMFPPGPQTEVIVPFRAGSDAEFGPAIKSDYFGPLPSERLRLTEQAAFFLADGKYRAKIGVSQRRARPLAGSLDLAAGVLTLVHFSMPDDPAAFSYVNNSWESPQPEPLTGDVFNSYNDGPPEPGKPSLGGFYELESMSPAAELPTGKSVSHTHATFHVVGDPATLVKLAEAALGVEIPPPPAQAADRRGK